METTNNVLQQTEESTPLESSKDFQTKLSANIMFALEVKNAFEMYSYRIISPEDFIERIKDLNEFQISTKK